MEIIRRRGRPPKRPMPDLPFDKIIKIREALIKAANGASYESKLRKGKPLPFAAVIEELSGAAGRFFDLGHEIRDGVEIVRKLNLELSDSEIKSILLQARLRHETLFAAPMSS